LAKADGGCRGRKTSDIREKRRRRGVRGTVEPTLLTVEQTRGVHSVPRSGAYRRNRYASPASEGSNSLANRQPYETWFAVIENRRMWAADVATTCSLLVHRVSREGQSGKDGLSLNANPPRLGASRRNEQVKRVWESRGVPGQGDREMALRDESRRIDGRRKAFRHSAAVTP
jgi:hypothetical protein